MEYETFFRCFQYFNYSQKTLFIFRSMGIFHTAYSFAIILFSFQGTHRACGNWTVSLWQHTIPCIVIAAHPYSFLSLSSQLFLHNPASFLPCHQPSFLEFHTIQKVISNLLRILHLACFPAFPTAAPPVYGHLFFDGGALSRAPPK